MSNWNQYRELWQQKRNELHVDSNAQTDWSEMQNILDQQMPVAPSEGAKPNTGTPKSPFTGFGPLSVISGLIVAGLVTYFALHTKPANTINKNYKPDSTEISKNNIPVDSNSSLNTANNANAANDSLTSNQPNTTADAAKANNGKTSLASTGLSSESNNNIATANNATSGKNNSKNGSSNNHSNSNNESGSAIATANNTTGRNETVFNKSRVVRHSSGGRPTSNTSVPSNLATLNNEVSSGNHRVNSHVSNRQQNNSRPGSNSQRDVQQYDANSPNNSGKYNPSKTAGFESVASLQLKWEDIVTGNIYTGQLPYPSISITKSFADKNSAARKSPVEKKSAKVKSPKAYGNGADIDWGILVGANTNGSFTTKEFNHNLYGSLGTDPYLGLFATGNINDHWSAGIQLKALVPHIVKGSYTHKNESKVDTGQVFQFQDLRKIYTVDIPIQAIYHLTPNLSLKGGPVVSIPVKQIGGSSAFEKGPERDNSGYYTQVDKALEATDFSKKIQVGLSGGVGVSYQFLSLDATYNYQLQSQKVSSPLGGYTNRMNGLQITLGIQLNKKKK